MINKQKKRGNKICSECRYWENYKKQLGSLRICKKNNVIKFDTRACIVFKPKSIKSKMKKLSVFNIKK